VLLEALGSLLIGLALAWAADRRLSERLPARRVVLLSGAAAALFGAHVTRAALGPEQTLGTLVGALLIGAVLLSLLLRPSRARLRAPLSL
jgi:hypothetical protein